MKIAIICLLLGLAGCEGSLKVESKPRESSTPQPQFATVVDQVPTDRDLELAALYNLDLPFSSAYFPAADKTLDKNQEWINKKRLWISTIQDIRVRKAYEHWIDYAQRRLDENREENKTHSESKAFDERKRKRNDELRRSQEAAKNIPKPPTP